LVVSLAAAAALGAAVAWLVSIPRKPFSNDDPRLAEDGDVERGRLVCAAGDCASCHASPGANPIAFISAVVSRLASPFGMFRAPNVSSHPNGGIGAWSTADLANAMIAGVSPCRRHYYLAPRRLRHPPDSREPIRHGP
jgi:hypothetical protein